MKTNLLALLLVASPVFAGNRIWIVSDLDCPGVDFATIQEAVDAAADGDTILVRPVSNAVYGSVDITGKSVTIASGAPNQFLVGGRIGDLTIRDLSSDQSVTILGIARTNGGRILLENNEGSIWIEDADFGSALTTFSPPHYERVRIEDCDSVLFVRATLRAPSHDIECLPSDPCFGIDGKDAMVVERSDVHLFDCVVLASDGGPGNDGFNPGPTAGAGGIGVRLVDSTLSAFGSLVHGGDGGTGGGPGPIPLCSDGGAGGAGILLTDPASAVRIQDCTVSGGEGGPWTTQPPFPNGCSDGADAPAFDGPGAGNVTTLAGVSRSIARTTPDPVVEGTSETLEIEGEPGDFVFLGVSPVPDAFYDPVFPGSAAFAPVRIFGFGMIGPSGSKSPTILVGELTRPGASVTAYLQTYHVDTALELFLGTPTAFAILDSSHDSSDACTGLVYVDDDAPGDPGPNDWLVSDPLEDGSLLHPFDTIPEAIANTLLFDARIIIADGMYRADEGGPLSLSSRKLSLESANGPDNCIFDATGVFTAISVSESALTLENEIRGLTVRGAGRALSVLTGSMTIADCVFEDGVAISGGIIETSNSDSVFENCIVRNNTMIGTPFGRGVIDVRWGSPTISGCLIVDNETLDGPALRLPRLGSTVRNCTIVNNSGGGGVHFTQFATGSANSVVSNSIVFGNSDGDQIRFTDGALIIRYGDVEGGLAGINSVLGGNIVRGPGLIDADPLFVDAANGDYHLSAGSPCIDAGDPAFVGAPGETDLDGDPRVQGAAVDLGADET